MYGLCMCLFRLILMFWYNVILVMFMIWCYCFMIVLVFIQNEKVIIMGDDVFFYDFSVLFCVKLFVIIVDSCQLMFENFVFCYL